MRKTPLKRSIKQMKRGKLNKVSKMPISKLQRKIWEHCKRIIRSKYGNSCYTCSKQGLQGSDWHTGHMIAKASLPASLKYDLRMLRPQCYHCNVNCGGQGAIFIENMRRIEGDEYVNSLLQDRQKIVNAYDYYTKLLEEYENTF